MEMEKMQPDDRVDVVSPRKKGKVESIPVHVTVPCCAYVHTVVDGRNGSPAASSAKLLVGCTAYPDLLLPSVRHRCLDSCLPGQNTPTLL